MNPRFMRNGLLMLVLVMGVSALLYTWLGSSSQTPPTAWGQFLTNVEKGEVAIGKRQSQDTQRVTDTVRREEAHVERSGDVNVQGTDAEDTSDQATP